MTIQQNADAKVVEGFGDEWTRFDQSRLPEVEQKQIFNNYFSVFPWDTLPPNPEGFDAGCGSGRWAQLVAPKVGTLNLIDASDAALTVARRNLAASSNVKFHLASVADIPLEDGSQDFGYSLGVLHHIPDTKAGLSVCVKKLKMGAPFLVYLYYSFDNRPLWFRAIWQASDLLRRVVSRLPHSARYVASQILAGLVYWPLARTALLIKKLGLSSNLIPLAAYRDKSFYTMRTDALDRFGTQLEQRFSRVEIAAMMKEAGLSDIKFAQNIPYWCAVGTRVS